VALMVHGEVHAALATAVTLEATNKKRRLVEIQT
jgi:hypothetical protein